MENQQLFGGNRRQISILSPFPDQSVNSPTKQVRISSNPLSTQLLVCDLCQCVLRATMPWFAVKPPKSVATM